MPKLSLVAIVVAKNNYKDLVENEIRKLIPSTRKEDGCLSYNLFIDNKNNNRFVFEENWETYDKWQSHMNGEAMRAYTKATNKAVESLDIIELTQLD